MIGWNTQKSDWIVQYSDTIKKLGNLTTGQLWANRTPNLSSTKITTDIFLITWIIRWHFFTKNYVKVRILKRWYLNWRTQFRHGLVQSSQLDQISFFFHQILVTNVARASGNLCNHFVDGFDTRFLSKFQDGLIVQGQGKWLGHVTSKAGRVPEKGQWVYWRLKLL